MGEVAAVDELVKEEDHLAGHRHRGGYASPSLCSRTVAQRDRLDRREHAALQEIHHLRHLARLRACEVDRADLRDAHVRRQTSAGARRLNELRRHVQRRGSLRPLDGSHLREESCGDELNDFGELRVRNFGNCVRDGKRDYRTRW